MTPSGPFLSCDGFVETGEDGCEVLKFIHAAYES